MSQPIMNETPCQHGNHACPLCDAPAEICLGCRLPEDNCCCGDL